MNFRPAVIATVLVVVAGPSIWMLERSQGRRDQMSADDVPLTALVGTDLKHISASGWIEGRTANVELRSRLAEQIVEVKVDSGTWVKQGDILLLLDSSQYLVELARAESQLLESQAKLQRVQNGFRDSEIEAARNDLSTRIAEWQGAIKSLQRMESLVLSRHISAQMFEDEQTRVKMLEGMASGARSRLETMEAPPREDELLAARASVAAAESFKSLAALNVERTKIRAPFDAKVLRVNVEVGELARPEQLEPLVVLSDVSALRAVVEIDEYDSLCVRVGQPAQLKADSSTHILARGKVAEIEPQLTHKQMDMSHPGERKDTFTRRIWIDLEDGGNLPVGLPVEVTIEACEGESTSLSVQVDPFEWKKTS
jgi:multidrug resistance efflux pump